MIDFFLDIIKAFYDALPGSFIQNADFFGNDVFGMIPDLMNYLNWFVPFDTASDIMAVWLPCILLYYIASSTRTVIKRLMRIFIDKL